MKYGIYYAYWERQWGADYRKYIRKAGELGFDILELACTGMKDMSEAEIEELKAVRDASGISLTAGHGPKPDQNLASPDPAIVENALEFWKETFRVLEKLDIKTVGGGLYGYWPVDYSKPVDKEGDLERSIENMRRMADIAADYGITTLGMEVLNRHEGYLLNTCKVCVDYVKAVDRPNVKVMLDTYHMLFEEDSFEDAILTAGPLLGHLHVGENNRKVPGQGHLINWDEIGSALHKIGYDGTVVMEPFVIHGGEVGKDIRIWRDLLPDVSEEKLDSDARGSVEFLRSMWG